MVDLPTPPAKLTKTCSCSSPGGGSGHSADFFFSYSQSWLADYSESSDPDQESSKRGEGDRSADVPEDSDDQESGCRGDRGERS
jgi:hypothetical protein